MREWIDLAKKGLATKEERQKFLQEMSPSLYDSEIHALVEMLDEKEDNDTTTTRPKSSD